MKILTIGSRRSQLAQVQSNLIRQQLLDIWPEIDVKIELIDTRGDLNRKDPLPAIGGKGLFTQELEAALRRHQIDLAVHSLKDLPVEDSPGLTVVAVPRRAAPQDMLVSHRAASIEALPQKAVVGTSSLRRAAQAKVLRPDLQIKDIRGNVETRLRKLDDSEYGYDAILLAQAGLDRLGLRLDHAHPIPYQVMLPAPGQGALGVQGRTDDPESDRYLKPLNHPATRAAVTAERAFLGALGGGCSLPVGAWAAVANNRLNLQAVVASLDGQQIIRVNTGGPLEAAEEMGQSLAAEARAKGAAELLAI